MGKFKKIYDLLGCDIDIPINDIDGWTMFPKYRWIYNKMEICDFQNIPYGPMPLEPKTEDYPIIIKPITNMYGMGLNVIKVDNEDQFWGQWQNTNFWMKFLDGDHMSWDLVIKDGKIKFYTGFLGYKNNQKIGKFDYWESKTRSKLPKIIKKLVRKRLSEYCGCLNVETIGGYIVECHLRMGDVDQLPTLDILKGIIATYKKENYNWKIVKNIPKIYFIPVWSGKYTSKKVTKFLKKELTNDLNNNQYICDYQIDDPTLSSPCDERRLMWFTCYDLNYGMVIRDVIFDKIKKYFCKL